MSGLHFILNSELYKVLINFLPKKCYSMLYLPYIFVNVKLKCNSFWDYFAIIRKCDCFKLDNVELKPFFTMTNSIVAYEGMGDHLFFPVCLI